MLGVLVNTATVILGSLLGLFCKKGIPKRVVTAVMIGTGGVVLYIGIDGVLKGDNPLITIFSIAFGAIVGTLIDIDRCINKLGAVFEKKFVKNEGVSVAEGFVTGSLLFCVGSMTIVGSLNSGLSGDHQMIYAKSILDLFSSMMLTASLGAGVMLSAVFVFVFQGAIVLLASVLAPILTQAAIAEIICAGSILNIFLSFNLMGLGKFKVANYLPAIFFAPIFTYLFELITKLLK